MHQQQPPAVPRPDFICPLDSIHARKQARLLRAVAEESRLKIISMLLHQPYTLGGSNNMNMKDIVVTLGNISQPCVSHHLRILCDAGILDYHREGLSIYYYVQHAALTEAYSAIYRERQEKSA